MTPEERLVLDYRNPGSKYHRAIHVSYPDADDRESASAAGHDPGGDIMIHGFPNALHGIGPTQKMHRWYGRWTAGCIAVTDKEMDEIREPVPNRTTIEVAP